MPKRRPPRSQRRGQRRPPPVPPPLPVRAAPVAAAPSVSATPAPEAPAQPAPARERAFNRFTARDYTYVRRELLRIVVLATAILILIFILSFFLP